jgi:hypothetical protein
MPERSDDPAYPVKKRTVINYRIKLIIVI